MRVNQLNFNSVEQHFLQLFFYFSGKEIRVSGYEDDVFEICNKIDQFLKRNRE